MSTPTAGQPVTAPAPYDGPLPGSGAYGIYQAQATSAYQSAMAQIQAQRSSLLSNSGFGGTYDPATGAFTGVSGPLANAPTGSYQQMMSQNAGQHASDNAAISGLGFHGGLANQAKDQSKMATSVNAANWAQNFQGSLADLGNQETNATSSYQSGLTNEMLNEVESGITNQTFNPGDPGTGNVTPPPFTGVAGGGGSSTPTVLGRTASGAPIYGYGKNGNPFLSASAAKAAGRLGKKKGK